MDIAVYGHYGFALLMFPAQTDDFLENENNGLVASISKFVSKGKCTIFSVGGVNFESWLSPDLSGEEKSKRLFEYNHFIVEEIIPYIFGQCGGPVPIITCGAAIGAFHAANNYFRRPDIFYGSIAMSGTYNIEHFTKGYFDENCYFNSPVHYLPNLNDSYWLSFLKSKHHVYLMTGNGENEHPYNSAHLGDILSYKEIPHVVDYWGAEWGHNWDTWNAMLPFILETKL
jgi:esterase/lipase superfamily enzyme